MENIIIDNAYEIHSAVLKIASTLSEDSYSLEAVLHACLIMGAISYSKLPEHLKNESFFEIVEKAMEIQQSTYPQSNFSENSDS